MAQALILDQVPLKRAAQGNIFLTPFELLGGKSFGKGDILTLERVGSSKHGMIQCAYPSLGFDQLILFENSFDVPMNTEIEDGVGDGRPNGPHGSLDSHVPAVVRKNDATTQLINVAEIGELPGSGIRFAGFFGTNATAGEIPW